MMETVMRNFYSYSFSVFSERLLIIAVTHVKGKKSKKLHLYFGWSFCGAQKPGKLHKEGFTKRWPTFDHMHTIHQEKKENKKQLTVWDTPPTVCSVIPTLLNHKYNEKGEARGEGGAKRKEVTRGPRSHQSDWQPWNGTIAGAPPHPGRSLRQPLSKSCIHEIEFRAPRRIINE